MVDPLFLLAPLALAALGIAFEAAGRRRESARFPAPGRRVLVGNTHLHVRTRGQGSPVIVLEAGAGAWSTHWDPLIGPLSELSSVVVYDRAGLGWSEAGEEPRSAESAATDLSELLRQVSPDCAEVLLVAHAEGARIARAFANRYPHRMAGVVFVDGYHESLEGDLRRAGVPSAQVSTAMLTGLLWAGRLGLLRLLAYPPLAAGLRETGLGRANLEAIAALSRSPRVLAGMRAEQRASGESDQRLAAGSLGQEVPSRTLVAGSSLPLEGLPRDFPREKFNSIWAQCSGRLASIFSGDPRAAEVLEEADHLLPLRHPQQVLACVRDLLQRER
jgi:pimeloyl-ACP methyl ester carboxylesterase